MTRICLCPIDRLDRMALRRLILLPSGGKPGEATLAQLVERSFRKAEVQGSSP